MTNDFTTTARDSAQQRPTAVCRCLAAVMFMIVAGGLPSDSWGGFTLQRSIEPAPTIRLADATTQTLSPLIAGADADGRAAIEIKVGADFVHCLAAPRSGAPLAGLAVSPIMSRPGTPDSGSDSLANAITDLASPDRLFEHELVAPGPQAEPASFIDRALPSRLPGSLGSSVSGLLCASGPSSQQQSANPQRESLGDTFKLRRNSGLTLEKRQARGEVVRYAFHGRGNFADDTDSTPFGGSRAPLEPAFALNPASETGLGVFSCASEAKRHSPRQATPQLSRRRLGAPQFTQYMIGTLPIIARSSIEMGDL